MRTLLFPILLFSTGVLLALSLRSFYGDMAHVAIVLFPASGGVIGGLIAMATILLESGRSGKGLKCLWLSVHAIIISVIMVILWLLWV